MGDRILSVNGVDIKNASHQEAVLALLTKTDRMKLKVQHDPLPQGFKVSKKARTNGRKTDSEEAEVSILEIFPQHGLHSIKHSKDVC